MYGYACHRTLSCMLLMSLRKLDVLSSSLLLSKRFVGASTHQERTLTSKVVTHSNSSVVLICYDLSAANNACPTDNLNDLNLMKSSKSLGLPIEHGGKFYLS